MKKNVLLFLMCYRERSGMHGADVHHKKERFVRKRKKIQNALVESFGMCSQSARVRVLPCVLEKSAGTHPYQSRTAGTD